MIGHSPDKADSLALAVYAMNHSNTEVEQGTTAEEAAEIASKYLYYYEAM